MKNTLSLALCVVMLLSACGVKDVIRKNDDRYATPGAMDSPLTGIYNTHRFNLLDKYQITHEWLESGCEYRGVAQPQARGQFFLGRDLVERGGKTWLRFSEQRLFDFDPWVGSVKEVLREKGKEGQVREIGFRPACIEHWWTSSHYLVVYLRHSSLADYEASLAKGYEKAQWSTRELNGITWRVAQVPPSQLTPRKPMGGGEAYQAWLTALGDTGYVMSFQMGSSKESLDYPKAHAAIEAVLTHLVGTVRIERLNP